MSIKNLVGICTSVILAGTVLCVNCYATDYELDRIIVTAKKGIGKEIRRIPANITVITSEDIESSNARSIPDLLNGEMGISVQDWLGNGKKVSIDMGGFGEVSSSNCLVLIDGRRINAVDMSNVDWSQVSLSQVERIEIIRGANSVFYGDNAVGGVINIITKKGQEKQQVKVKTLMNTPNGISTSVGLGGLVSGFTYSLNAGYGSSTGFRKNNAMEAYDIGARLSGNPLPWLSVDVSSGFHNDVTGMPGPVTAAQWRAGQYAEAKTPNDYTTTKDQYFRVSVGEELLGKRLMLETLLGWRKIYNRQVAYPLWDSAWSMWFSGTYNNRDLSVLSWSQKCFYELGPISARVGIEGEYGTYDVIVTDTYGAFGGSDERIIRNTIGTYASGDISLLDNNFLITVGIRREYADHSFDSSVYSTTVITTRDVSSEMLDAYSAGLSYSVTKNLIVFGSINKILNFLNLIISFK